MGDKEATLRQHPFLVDLDVRSFDFLAGCAQETHNEADSFLIREGDPADRLFLIQTGRVALEIHAGPRGTVQVESVGAGDILGLSWLGSGARWQLDARAVEPVLAFTFDAACLRREMEADHDLGYALSKRILAQAIKRLERVRLQRLDLFRAEEVR